MDAPRRSVRGVVLTQGLCTGTMCALEARGLGLCMVLHAAFPPSTFPPPNAFLPPPFSPLSSSSPQSPLTLHNACRHVPHPLSSPRPFPCAPFALLSNSGARSSPSLLTPHDARRHISNLLRCPRPFPCALHSGAGAGSQNGAALSGDAGMAEALSIGPRTAVAITTLITCAAFVLPLTMRAWAPGASAHVKGLTYLTLLLGFYMAWNIGANDVANAMGTSVGSGALSLRQVRQAFTQDRATQSSWTATHKHRRYTGA